jgi:hypothetical protein
VRVPSNTNPTNPQIMGSYVAARSEDGGAALNELVRGRPDHGNHDADRSSHHIVVRQDDPSAQK